MYQINVFNSLNLSKEESGVMTFQKKMKTTNTRVEKEKKYQSAQD